MKLVIHGTLPFTKTTEGNEKMNTYKYREDVVITESPDEKEQIRLLAGAYAFIHTPLEDNDVIPLLQAMQCNTPAISFPTDCIKEYTDEAIITTEQNNYDQLAEKMILLYKDETLRSQLIEKGRQRAQQYIKEKAMSALLPVLSFIIP